MTFGKRFRNLWRECNLTERIMVVFTGVLAAASIYQFIIMGGQLDTMRKDQRPWINVSFTQNPLQVFAPIGGTIHLTNTGKTPARVIVGDFVIEKVKNREQPVMDYAGPVQRTTRGMITPNDDTPSDMLVHRIRSGVNNAVEVDPLTAPEFEDFNQLNIFFVLYGTVHYTDFFGAKHWTKFCRVIGPPNPPIGSTFSGKKCTDYPDIDSN